MVLVSCLSSAASTSSGNWARIVGRRSIRQAWPTAERLHQNRAAITPGEQLRSTVTSKTRQDVLKILSARTDVITTVNIQHLESIADEVEQITGAPTT